MIHDVCSGIIMIQWEKIQWYNGVMICIYSIYMYKPLPHNLSIISFHIYTLIYTYRYRNRYSNISCIYIYIFMYIRSITIYSVYIYTCICMYIYMFIYIYIYVCLYVYIHMYMRELLWNKVRHLRCHSQGWTFCRSLHHSGVGITASGAGRRGGDAMALIDMIRSH